VGRPRKADGREDIRNAAGSNKPLEARESPRHKPVGRDDSASEKSHLGQLDALTDFRLWSVSAAWFFGPTSLEKEMVS
jgi:hypothetical protein